MTSDDWATGSLAAAYGGTTTLIDFVEPQAGQPLLAALAQRRAQAEGRAYVDFALHMTLVNADSSTLAQIPSVIAAGVPSFKLYTTYAGFALDDKALIASFEAIGSAGGLAMLHAENDAIIQHSLGKLNQAGQLTPGYFPASRPAVAEIEAIQRAILLARFTGVALYIVHISTAEGAEAVANARRLGQPVYGETCPQYLLLDESCYQDTDPYTSLKVICAPPLRKAKDRQALWERLQVNELQTVCTDHCAFNLHGQKDSGLESFTLCPSGLPGVEARLALLYSFGVATGRISLQQWVSYCSTTPAQIFGLYPRKGSLEIGADADIVVFDPACQVVLNHSMLHENVDYTPYEGMLLQGWPAATFLSGHLITGAAHLRSKPKGQFIPAYTQQSGV
jgi:dihydropyrimidinase